MTRRSLVEILGTGQRDPGCDAAFEVLDQYVEAVRRGVDVGGRFPDFLSHLQNCPACREDTEGMLAALNHLDPPPGR